MTNEQRERARALAVIAKAERDEIDPVDHLISHMVSKSLIEELTGKIVNLDRKPRKRNIDSEMVEWASKNVGTDLTVSELQGMIDVSNSVALKLVKNTDYFVKVRRGVYQVRDGKAEREAAKSNKNL